MNKIIALLIMLSPALLFAQNFKITGKIGKASPRVTKVALYYARNGQNILDSVDVKNGSYTFEGTVSQPTRADILAKYDGKVQPRMSRDLKTIFIEPGNITIHSTDSFSNAAVAGSAANAEFEKLQNMAKPYMHDAEVAARELEAYTKARNTAARDRVQTQIDNINNDLKENVYKKYFTANPNSPIALFALQQYAGVLMNDPEEAKSLFDQLPEKVKQSGEGRRFSQLISFTMRGNVGKNAPEFTQNDKNGKPVKLSALKGSYILLNFWASWCAPCRAETPTLTDLSKKFGSSLKIISVSLDKPGEKKQWLEAISKDSMTWTQISDLQFWNNEVAVKYGVSSIPQNILIDRSGKIIARNLRGEALQQKIAELLK